MRDILKKWLKVFLFILYTGLVIATTVLICTNILESAIVHLLGALTFIDQVYLLLNCTLLFVFSVEIVNVALIVANAVKKIGWSKGQ